MRLFQTVDRIQGSSVNIGGSYLPDAKLAELVMRQVKLECNHFNNYTTGCVIQTFYNAKKDIHLGVFFSLNTL